MAGLVRSFMPSGNAVTVNLAVTAGSARVAVLSANTTSNQANYSVRVYNAGSIPVWIEFGDVTITAASATGLIVAGGTSDVFRLNPGNTYVAGIATTTGATVYFTPGDGV